MLARSIIASLAISVILATGALASPLGVEADRERARIQGRFQWGFRVTAVTPGGAAELAGLRQDDFVIDVFVGGGANNYTELNRIERLLEEEEEAEDGREYRLIAFRAEADGTQRRISIPTFPGGIDAFLMAERARLAEEKEFSEYLERRSAMGEPMELPWQGWLVVVLAGLAAKSAVDDHNFRSSDEVKAALANELTDPEQYAKICRRVTLVEVQNDGGCTPSTLEAVELDICKGTTESPVGVSCWAW